MSCLYVPYAGRELASITVKGHKFLLLARTPEIMEAGLQLLGADDMKEVDAEDPDLEDQALDELAEEVNGNIVVVPDEVTVFDILDSLQTELPWLH